MIIDLKCFKPNQSHISFDLLYLWFLIYLLILQLTKELFILLSCVNRTLTGEIFQRSKFICFLLSCVKILFKT